MASGSSLSQCYTKNPQRRRRRFARGRINKTMVVVRTPYGTHTFIHIQTIHTGTGHKQRGAYGVSANGMHKELSTPRLGLARASEGEMDAWDGICNQCDGNERRCFFLTCYYYFFAHIVRGFFLLKYAS